MEFVAASARFVVAYLAGGPAKKPLVSVHLTVGSWK